MGTILSALDLACKQMTESTRPRLLLGIQEIPMTNLSMKSVKGAGLLCSALAGNTGLQLPSSSGLTAFPVGQSSCSGDCVLENGTPGDRLPCSTMRPLRTDLCASEMCHVCLYTRTYKMESPSLTASILFIWISDDDNDFLKLSIVWMLGNKISFVSTL